MGMGRDLAESSPQAKQWFQQADAVLGYDLSRICFEGPEPQLIQTENAQPGIYLVGWVAFELLKAQVPNLEFQATAGLSLGEFTALAAAGALSFEDGLSIVRQRGQFMQQACDATQGGMAAIIGLEASKTQEICDRLGVTLANLNCPGQLVISGPSHLMEKACEAAKAAGAKKAMPLKVAGAYHSPLMSSAQPKLQQALNQIVLHSPKVEVISNVTARPHEGPSMIASRLVDQVTSSVRWEESIRYLIGQGFTRFIELGPGKALSGFVKRISDQVQILNVNDGASLAATVAALQPAAVAATP